MITIFSNITGHPLCSGDTLDNARALLTLLDCSADTEFGPAPCDLTALDTGSADVLCDHSDAGMLHAARRRYTRIGASGAARNGRTGISP